jgi:hypothetical protein
MFDPEIPSYPHLKSVGHRAHGKLFEGEVIIQSKIDGSNVSFWKDEKGKVWFRSRNLMLYHETEKIDRQFDALIETVTSISDRLDPRFIYRGEYLRERRHNRLEYDRVPEFHVVLFDLQDSKTHEYLGLDSLLEEAKRVGFDVVPVLFRGTMGDGVRGILNNLLSFRTTTPSVAGSETRWLGEAFEGIVIKNYAQKDPYDERCPLIAKLVCEEFRELAGVKQWIQGPGITTQLGDALRTDARYFKALQHLRENCVEFKNTPEDIPMLAEEVKRDIVDEELDMILDRLWDAERSKYKKSVKSVEEFKMELWETHKNPILKKATSDIGVWYKALLAARNA